MDYDEYLESERVKTDKQERKPMYECRYCGADIYKGEDYHELDNEIFCCNCFDEIIIKDSTRIAGEE